MDMSDNEIVMADVGLWTILRAARGESGCMNLKRKALSDFSMANNKKTSCEFITPSKTI